MSQKPTIERDQWLRVRTADAAGARRFFGVEATREVVEEPNHPYDEDDGLKTYRVAVTIEELEADDRE